MIVSSLTDCSPSLDPTRHREAWRYSEGDSDVQRCGLFGERLIWQTSQWCKCTGWPVQLWINTFCAIDVANFKPGCFNHKGLCQLYNRHLLYSQQRKELVRPPVRRARVTMQYSSHFKHFRNWNILVGFVKCGMSNAQKCLIHELRNSNPVSTIVCSLVPTFLGSFMVMVYLYITEAEIIAHTTCFGLLYLNLDPLELTYQQWLKICTHGT